MQQTPGSIPLDLEAAGRLIGSYRWVEKQLFQLLGGWTTLVSEPAVKLFLDQQSFEFAWHAELWAGRLPDHHGVSISGLTAPANSGVAAAFKELAGTAGQTTTAEKLAAVYRVLLPRLITAYSGHLSQATAVANDPTQRALRLILADELAAWRSGEAHLEALLIDADSIEKAANQQSRTEALLVDGGGIGTLAT